MITKVFDVMKKFFYKDKLNYTPFIVCVVLYIVTYFFSDYFLWKCWDEKAGIKEIAFHICWNGNAIVGIICFIQMIVMSIRSMLSKSLVKAKKIIYTGAMLFVYFVLLIYILPYVSAYVFDL